MTLEDPDSPLRPDKGEDDGRDARFDPNRYPARPPALRVTAEIVGMIQRYEQHFGLRKRRRRPADQRVFEEALTAILTNAIRRDLLEPQGWVAVPLGKSVLGRRPTRYSYRLPTTLPYLLDLLTKPEMDFIELRKGERSVRGLAKGRLTTFRATARLRGRIEEHGVRLGDIGQRIEQETIILKEAKVRGSAESIDYEDDDRLVREREALYRINKHLMVADIEVDNDVLTKTVDPSSRLLRRYFNNGSFEQGGRLFGAFWQDIPKDERPGALRIDGEEVAVLDYSQMGIRLLYALEGLPAPAGDAYMPPAPHWWRLERPYWHRDAMKKVLNAMLCREGQVLKMPRGTRKLFNTCSHLRAVKVQEVVSALHTHHGAVVHRFGTGYGLRLMRVESDILIDVLLTLMDEGITALPVHDAIVVASSKKERATCAMVEAFKKRTGAVIEVRKECAPAMVGAATSSSPASSSSSSSSSSELLSAPGISR